MHDKCQFKYWQKIFETKIGRGRNGRMGKAKESPCDLYGRFLRHNTHGWTFEDRKKFSIPSRNLPRIATTLVHICMRDSVSGLQTCASFAFKDQELKIICYRYFSGNIQNEKMSTLIFYTWYKNIISSSEKK